MNQLTYEQLVAAYSDGGYAAVEKLCEPHNLPRAWCEPCEMQTPTFNEACACCGTVRETNLDGHDWVLKGEGKEPVASTWITVGNVSLKVSRDQHSMHVVALPLGQEMNDAPLAEFTLWFSDVQGEIEDTKEEVSQ